MLAGLIVNNMKSPDIISIEEIQDNSGATDDGPATGAQVNAFAAGPFLQVAWASPWNAIGQPAASVPWAANENQNGRPRARRLRWTA